MTEAPRTLIVSNRLPIHVRHEDGRLRVLPSAGGLATAMRGVHETGASIWIGWPGDVTRITGAAQSELARHLDELRVRPVYLAPEEVRGFYENFSNQVLWPVCHYMPDRIPLHGHDWDTYVAVNERFAEAVCDCYRDGDRVWVHDYQLLLVPALLRRRLPRARIGFFLHIPFPAWDVFRTLPWREPLLRGLLGADLVGFHTYLYQRHFQQSLLLGLGLESDGELVHVDGRDVRLGTFPIGIDAARFEALGADAGVIADAEALRASAPGQKLLLGIDRLDYTKGVPRRLLAFERLLEREPSLRGKVRLLQVAVPTRDSVPAYDRFRRSVHELVGRINGEQATEHSAPIHFLARQVNERQLAAMYRAADVMLVTALRDGMNLVAKEFVATRADEAGVLLLSEFAGAAAELGEAIIVNPWDVDGVAAAMKRALDMTDDEARARMRALRRRVAAAPAAAWAGSFLAALDAAPVVPAEEAPVFASAEERTSLVDRLRAASGLLVLLDYDGTLVPFAGAPELAVPDPPLLSLLGRLAARPHTRVHIVSGRSRETLERWLGALPVGLHAEHGFWSRHGRSEAWTPAFAPPAEWKERAREILDAMTLRTPGSLVEEKTAAVAWHYRMCDPELGARHARELRRWFEHERALSDFELLAGDKVLEIRLRGVHKGVIMTGVLAAAPLPGPITCFAAGDDRTDEDLFAALPPGGVSVHVGGGTTRARMRLESPAALRALLATLAR